MRPFFCGRQVAVGIQVLPAVKLLEVDATHLQISLPARNFVWLERVQALPEVWLEGLRLLLRGLLVLW